MTLQAEASELLENHEEMFPRYCMDCNVNAGSNLQLNTGVRYSSWKG